MSEHTAEPPSTLPARWAPGRRRGLATFWGVVALAAIVLSVAYVGLGRIGLASLWAGLAVCCAIQGCLAAQRSVKATPESSTIRQAGQRQVVQRASIATVRLDTARVWADRVVLDLHDGERIDLPLPPDLLERTRQWAASGEVETG